MSPRVIRIPVRFFFSGVWPLSIDVSVVIVSFNTEDLLRRGLESLFVSERWHLDGWCLRHAHKEIVSEVLVVDNGSDDQSPGMVAKEFPWVRLVANFENVGFARANNQAMGISSGRYIFLLNPDTETVAGAITSLVEFADDHPNAGAVGCQLLNPDGSLQPSGRDLPTIRSVWKELLPMPEAIRRRTRSLTERRDYSKACEVEEVSGAAMLVRREAMSQVGGLDEDFFFLGEDVDFCWRLKDAGWRAYYLPSARVVHHWGVSRSGAKRERISLLAQRAQYLLFKKHRKGWEAALVKAALLPVSLLKLSKSVASSLVKRDLKAVKIDLYLFASEMSWLWHN